MENHLTRATEDGDEGNNYAYDDGKNNDDAGQSVGEVVMLLDLDDVLLSGPSSSINSDSNLVDLNGQSEIISSTGTVSSEADLLLSTGISQGSFYNYIHY